VRACASREANNDRSRTVIRDYVECPTDGVVREPFGFLTNARRDFFFLEKKYQVSKKKFFSFDF